MKRGDVSFEEAISDEWAGDLQIAEVKISKTPFLVAFAFAFFAVASILARVAYLQLYKGDYFFGRSRLNLVQLSYVAPPRGQIRDRFGYVLADNKVIRTAMLDTRTFLREKNKRQAALTVIKEVFGVEEREVMSQIEEKISKGVADPIVISQDISKEKAEVLGRSGISSLYVSDAYKRNYYAGEEFSSLVGYTSLSNPQDLEADPSLSSSDDVGRAGIEKYYEWFLRGTPGETIRARDAQGRVLEEHKRSNPKEGPTIKLSIDGEFQRFAHRVMKDQLASLGRNQGIVIAMDPRNGEILAYENFPTYDNNIFADAVRSKERMSVITSPERLLFNKGVSGLYNPASTIKPMVGIAALAEKVIDPYRSIFSPGYIDIPNPYNPDKPTRYLDWRYQGYVDLSEAIAKSSDVYFYAVVGGTPEIKGMGITKLKTWWRKFGFGSITGIDLPGEEKGFLPDPSWKERIFKRAWTIGDSYNVSIGQGDFLVTPMQLINHMAAIANGGSLLKPFLSLTHGARKVVSDLGGLAKEIRESQIGMREAVTSAEGTAYRLHDLPFDAAAKTGTAQTKNKTQENSFFIGYAPYDNPQVLVMVIVENAKTGALNTVPVGRELLSWYWENRIKDSEGDKETSAR